MRRMSVGLLVLVACGSTVPDDGPGDDVVTPPPDTVGLRTLAAFGASDPAVWEADCLDDGGDHIPSFAAAVVLGHDADAVAWLTAQSYDPAEHPPDSYDPATETLVGVELRCASASPGNHWLEATQDAGKLDVLIHNKQIATTDTGFVAWTVALHGVFTEISSVTRKDYEEGDGDHDEWL